MGHEENPVAPTLVTTGTEDADLRLDRVEQFTRSGTIPTPVQTALDGRYAPLDSARVWLDFEQFQGVSGTFTKTQKSSGFVWYRYGSVPDAATTVAIATTMLPPHWATFDVYEWTINPTSGSGDVTVVRKVYPWGNGDTPDLGDSNTILNDTETFTVGTEDDLRRVKITDTPIANSPGEFFQMYWRRNGSAGGDTIAAAYGFIAYEFVPATFG